MGRVLLCPLWCLSVMVFLGGCGGNPQPRLPDLLGEGVSKSSKVQPIWPQIHQIGLLVHSDSTGPESAPAISATYLDTLGQRIERMLIQRCGMDSVVPVEFSVVERESLGEKTTNVLQLGENEQGLSHVLLVVFSSTEKTGPTTVGEARMMTQIRGIAVENSALAEVGLLRVADSRLLIDLSDQARETLDMIDAPLGDQQLSKEESLAILRAQAAQQALDQSLQKFGQWCGGTSAET